ncbi:MAG: CoA-transferase subunit beta [Bryobacteraceae bacterium]
MKTAVRGQATARGYTAGELMVAAAAREIRDSEIVFVGMRLPLLAFAVAKNTHAPSAIGLFENGIIRETPARELLYTMADPPNLSGATLTGTMLDVMGFLQQGRVNVGFLGAAEVDRFGNLNTTWGRSEGRPVRLPGAGGACDIACMAQRTVVLLEHSKRRLVERAGYVTSPGFGTGGGWRKAQGLPAHSGPSAVITTRGVLRFDGNGGAYLASTHPGERLEDVLHETGWELRVADDLGETPPPTEGELTVMRELDPKNFWTK